MRYGIREICDVVFKTTVANQKIGSKTFPDKGTPVIYFDSLKTSTMEQATTTVYAQGGRGNTRLVAWEGEKTLTFTMEDALISEMGIAILSGANLFEAGTGDTLLIHVTEKTANGKVSKQPAKKAEGGSDLGVKFYALELDSDGEVTGAPTEVTIADQGEDGYEVTGVTEGKIYLIDYYTEKTTGATQIDIEPQSFGGNFYIEADTLFRDTNGADHAAQFIIPNGKVQSNFTFTMASSGDPSTFTFTVDAFPGCVNGDLTKKVLSAIQIIKDNYGIDGVIDPAGDKEDSKWTKETTTALG